MNFYKRHIGDYIKDAAHLSLLEHGVYARLMDVYYTREAGIPDGQAARLIGARSRDEQQAVKNVLGEFFHLIEGTWVQNRCEREIEEASAQAEKNRLNGKKGGRPPKNKTPIEPRENPVGYESENPMGFVSDSQKNLSQTPDTRHQTPDKTSGELTASSAPESRAIPNPPRQPGDWLSHFRQKHGLQLDPSSVHDRKKVWPIFTGWCNAGLTLERVDAAVTQAQAQATETIAFLPGYVDRVIASQAAPKQTATATRDQERADVIATLTGRKQAHERTPDTLDVIARRVD